MHHALHVLLGALQQFFMASLMHHFYFCHFYAADFLAAVGGATKLE